MGTISLLHEVLVFNASDRADSIAVRCGKTSITYGELNKVSDQLSYFLIKSGVCRRDRVAIYLDKSISSIIAIFAILKTGATYVPLDIAAPVSRTTNILNDCKAKILISSKLNICNLLKNIDQFTLVPKIILTEQNITINYPVSVSTWNEVLLCEAPIQIPNIIEYDLAYILYTSGSTGIPKGVMVNHRAAIVFINWACNVFKIMPGEIVSNHAPLHFDLSIFDIFATIKSGGIVTLIAPNDSLFPSSLAALIAQEKVNIWYSVPSMLIKLILYGDLKKYNFSNLRLILFAGEVLPVKYLKELMTLLPHVHYYNLYGPTETNVCTYYKVTSDDWNKDVIPIGKACSYNEVILLNGNKILKVTDSGEGVLCVRGPNVMTGYWNNHAKTIQSKKMVAICEDLGEEPVYCTGDWAKRDVEGNIIYLGRTDGMIKSRGYRIELGEIETILYNHPDIERVAAVKVADLESTNLIKVFITLRKGAKAVDERAIKTFCSTYLPRYMVPQFVVFMEELPETLNGKIDKIKLEKEK